MAKLTPYDIISDFFWEPRRQKLNRDIHIRLNTAFRTLNE